MVTSWPFNDRPAGFSLPDLGLSPDDHEGLTGQMWSWLLTGMDDAASFAAMVDGNWPLTREQVRQAFELARDTRLRQQAQWTDEHTRTNIDLAFAELNDAGILARRDFTCCGTCGAAEIGDERDESREWRGYVFFHQQDTSSLIGSGTVYLSYGAFPPHDLRQVISEEVVPCLTSHGMQVEWNGDEAARLLVRDAQWYIKLA